MNFDELYNRINAQDYNSKLPYPPYRKDPAEREKYTKEDILAREAYRKDDNRLQSEFTKALRECCEDKLGQSLTDDQWSAIYSKAYEDGHSSGYSEVTNEANDLLDLVKVFLK